jgi:hypothetical protein
MAPAEYAQNYEESACASLGDMAPDLLTSVAHAVVAISDSPRDALRNVSALASTSAGLRSAIALWDGAEPSLWCAIYGPCAWRHAEFLQPGSGSAVCPRRILARCGGSPLGFWALAATGTLTGGEHRPSAGQPIPSVAGGLLRVVASEGKLMMMKNRPFNEYLDDDAVGKLMTMLVARVEPGDPALALESLDDEIELASFNAGTRGLLSFGGLRRPLSWALRMDRAAGGLPRGSERLLLHRGRHVEEYRRIDVLSWGRLDAVGADFTMTDAECAGAAEVAAALAAEALAVADVAAAAAGEAAAAGSSSSAATEEHQIAAGLASMTVSPADGWEPVPPAALGPELAAVLEQPLATGLHSAGYGPHGRELLLVRRWDQRRRPAEVAPVPGRASRDAPFRPPGRPDRRGAAWDEKAWWSPHTFPFKGARLEALKVTGDANVPAGHLTWVADASAEGTLDLAALHALLGERPIVDFEVRQILSPESVLAGTVACRAKGQINSNPPAWDPSWVDCVLLLPSPLAASDGPSQDRHGGEEGGLAILWCYDERAVNIMRLSSVPPPPSSADAEELD